MIGAAFGVIFVIVNSGDPVNGTATLLLRAGAVLTFGVILLLTVLTLRSPPSGAGRPALGAVSKADIFGRTYRIVVAIELASLFVGFQVIRVIDAPRQAGVAWVAVVVGLHFIALARVWREPSVLVPGVALSVLGLIGLVAVPTDAVEWVPLVSGVLSGATLLACALFAAATRGSGSVPP